GRALLRRGSEECGAQSHRGDRHGLQFSLLPAVHHLGPQTDGGAGCQGNVVPCQ
ncbi:unnamed protein product, partial [Heterosigma akashiwo]